MKVTDLAININITGVIKSLQKNYVGICNNFECARTHFHKETDAMVVSFRMSNDLVARNLSCGPSIINIKMFVSFKI